MLTLKKYNGFEVGDMVEYLKEYEDSDKRVALDVGCIGTIKEFIPRHGDAITLEYKGVLYTARVQFSTTRLSDKRLTSMSWLIPASEEYLRKITEDKTEIKIDILPQEKTREALWNILQ